MTRAIPHNRIMCIRNRASLIGLQLTGLAESALFSGLRLLAVPAWIRFRAVAPEPRWLSYAKLLLLASQHQPIPKPSPTTQRNRQLKWAKRVARIANIYQASAILEVGCGNGVAINHLREKGFWAVGVDIQPIFASQIRYSQNCFALADACKCLPFADCQFDLVFSIDAFEHFHNPTVALTEMIRVLKPGGVVYVAFGPCTFLHGACMPHTGWVCPIPNFFLPLKRFNAS